VASDPDLGANSMISYTVISDWANDVFSLNPQTGVFTLTARLDYEEVSRPIQIIPILYSINFSNFVR
jgi:protocadherin Fat 4